jgi:hypothetical protein
MIISKSPISDKFGLTYSTLSHVGRSCIDAIEATYELGAEDPEESGEPDNTMDSTTLDHVTVVMEAEVSTEDPRMVGETVSIANARREVVPWRPSGDTGDETISILHLHMQHPCPG